MKRKLSSVLLACLLLAVLLTGELLAGCKPSGPSGEETSADTPTEAPETEAPTEPETEPETEEDTTPVAPFSVCLYTGDLENGVSGTYESLDEAIEAAQKKAYLGLRVCDANGRLVYAPYTELQCDLLREAKWVTDYVRENRFKYGDAPINPAMDCSAKLVSCDRLVEWVYYRVGFTDPPKSHGLVVSNFFPWCEQHGFEKITKVRDLQPGDLVGVRPSANGQYPEHVFMFAGPTNYERSYVGRGNCLRYDCGSDTRIQSVQPFNEPINDFMCAYRPVIHTGSLTKLSKDMTLTLDIGPACEWFVAVRDAVWGQDDTDADYNYAVTIDGKDYLYEESKGIIKDVETGNVGEVPRAFRTSFRDSSRKMFK